MTSNIERVVRTGTAEQDGTPVRENDPVVGRWFWVKKFERTLKGKAEDYEEGDEYEYEYIEQAERWFACVTHVGSNYARIQGVNGGWQRISFSDWDEYCEREENPQHVILLGVGKHQLKVKELMGEVQEITKRLAITMGAAALVDNTSATQALAVHGDGKAIVKYKDALILAKEKELPELFKAIGEENEKMARWMKAELIPLKAEAEALKPAIDLIENRIFNVELYAGLVEQVVQVKEGKPAAASEKLHLFQRRAYMDEECLARYECGGMEFDDIEDFDKWLVKKANLDRLLPMPRCILAFRVRRHTKNREDEPVASISAAYVRLNLEKADKLTFLYIRNGEQVFRLSTEIEFGAKLFPDFEESRLSGQLYAVMDFGGTEVKKVISEGEYLDLVRLKKERKAKYKAEMAAWKKLPKKEQTFHTRPYYSSHGDDAVDNARKFSPGDVYYDDMQAHVKEQIDEHNRLVLVLQGLLDRSPALHPHPAWKLWTEQGFNDALKLIYDDSRTLSAGAKPDFQAYWDRLNASLTPGCITVGQQDFWERLEAVKENARERNRYRYGRGYERSQYVHFRPEGNPGPGVLAKVQRMSKPQQRSLFTGKAVGEVKEQTCTFEWTRERQRGARYPWGVKESPFIKCTVAAPISKVFNVSAYKAGDFHQFFDDPRTRADYIQWAPFMLEAEEMLAGNRPNIGGTKLEAADDETPEDEES